MPPNIDSTSIDHSFYPSAKVRLIVRFDELGSSSSVVAGAQKLVPHTVLRGTSSPRAPLVVSSDPTSPQGVNRLLIAPAGSGTSGSGGPQAQVQSSDNLTYAVAGIIPKRATWEANGIRAADTLSVKLRWIDCPVDPRAIRSCGVEFYCGTVDADDYRKGVQGGSRTASSGGAAVHGVTYDEPLTLIPDSYVDRNGVQRTNLRFQGFVDTWEVEHGDDDEATITLDCRDNTQLLIDCEAPSALVVGGSPPIDQAIATYLANFPHFAGFTVEYRPSGQPPPSLGAAVAGTAYQKKLDGIAPARGGGATQKLAVWDYLTDLVGALGLIIYIDGTNIVIQAPQTLYANQQSGGTSSGRSDDPFVEGGGRTVDGVAYQRRVMILGRNIRNQKIKRSFNRNSPTCVEVRCYSPRRKKYLVSRFPDPTTAAGKLAIKALPGNSADQKWMVWRVRWIEDQATLDRIAQQIYQNGRNEFLIDVDTHDLSSFGGGNTDPDILDLKAGDPFDVLVAQDPDSNAYGQTEQQLISQTNAYMQGLAYDPGFAAAYSAVYQADVGFQVTFRLKALSLEWDADAGDGPAVALAIHGSNWVEVRLDRPLQG